MASPELRDQIKKNFTQVYEKYKGNFYQNLFQWMDRKENSLTPVETVTAEVINILDEPTVNELVQFLRVSYPNIAYKINSLVNKGYLEKIQSETDKREFKLRLTDQFYSYYNNKNEYTFESIDKLGEELSDEQAEALNSVLVKLDQDLLSEGKMDEPNETI
mgnify:CR=1 FL=1